MGCLFVDPLVEVPLIINKIKQEQEHQCVLLHQRKWEPVVPSLIMFLPSFKVKLLPSTEVPSTSYTINAILVITFVCLVMSCHVTLLNKRILSRRKQEFMKHPRKIL